MRGKFQKKVRKGLSLSLAFGVALSTAFGVSGCGFALANTEDKMYEAIKDATKALMKYDEEMTMDLTVEASLTGSGVSQGSFVATDITYSFDPKEKQMFAVVDITVTQGSQSVSTTTELKVFKENDKRYVYQTVWNQGSTVGKTECYQVSESYLEQVFSMDFLSYLTETDLSAFEEAFSYGYEETKNAYEQVYAEQLAKRKEVDPNAIAEQTTSLKKDGNTITFDSNATVQTVSTDTKYNVKKTEKEKIVGEKNKITEVYAEQEISLLRATTGNVNKSERVKVDAKINYEFDEEGYDEIKASSVGAPDGVLSSYGGGQYGITFNVGGCISEEYATASNMRTSGKYLFSKMSEKYRGGGYEVEWYRDSYYTVALDTENLTTQQLKKLDAVYGKVNISEGCAVCAVDFEVRDERSEAYKIVFGKKTATYAGQEKFEAKIVGDNSRYEFLPYDDYIQEIYVNGTKQETSAMGIDLQAKQFYLVQYVEKHGDENCSIFDIENDFTL